MKESTKKAVVIGGCVFLVFCVFSVIIGLLFGEYPNEGDPNYEPKYESGTAQREIENLVSKYANEELDDVSVDKITINEHMGTDNPDDYIVLAYLNWDKKYVSNYSAKDTLSDYCAKTAKYIEGGRIDVQEFAIFWTIPYLDNEQTKCNYKRDENGMQIYDATGILNSLKTSSYTSNTIATASNNTQTSDRKDYIMGEEFDINGFTVKFGPEYKREIIQNQFDERNGQAAIGVLFTETNKTDNPTSFNHFDFTLYSPSGFETSTALGALFDDSNISAKSMMPGNTQSSYIYFLDEGVGNYQLYIDKHDGGFGDQVIVTLPIN